MAVELCIAGYGSIAEWHARAFREQGARVRWVVGPNLAEAGAFARRHGAAHFGDDLAEALKDDRIHSVVIASPTQLHEEQTRQALEAGKHVLCEIPLALSLAASEELAALADRHGVVLAVAHTQRFYAGLALLHQRIARGEFRPTHIIARYVFRRHENVSWTGRRRSWVDNLLWHHGCHAVDTALWLLDDEPARISGSLGPATGPLDISMEASVTFQTRNGGLATIALSYNSKISASDYLIIGEEETFIFSEQTLRSHSGIIYEPPPGQQPELDAMSDQSDDFLAAATGVQNSRVAVWSIVPAMRVLQAVQDEWRT